VQQDVNFGPYDPNSTYTFDLSFEATASSAPYGDGSAQLYVGFSPSTCSYNWLTLRAGQPWTRYTIHNTDPGAVPSGQSPYVPPSVVCFMNKYGQHGTVLVRNPRLTIYQNGHPVYRGPSAAEIGPGANLSENNICACTRTHTSNPVNSATGDFFHTFDDISIPGRGIPLRFTRTYNSLAAGQDGPLGYGWSGTYNATLTADNSGVITATQENGATATFTPMPSGGYQAPGRVLATLIANADGTLTLARKDQTRLTFTAPTPITPGVLLSETDRNNYTTALTYTNGLLSTVTDPSGRFLRFAYTGSHIKSITDPIGRTVVFTYDVAGNLTDAQDVAWGVTHFTYTPGMTSTIGAHLLLGMTDPNRGVLTNVYDTTARVIRQTDPLSRTTSFAYQVNPDLSRTTTITDPNGNITTETYQNNILQSSTKGNGTPQAASWSYTYDPDTLGVASATDPNGHTSYNSYDANGNLLSHTDALGRTTSYAYDALNDMTAITDPLGLVTTKTYDANGNLLSVSRPLTTMRQSGMRAMNVSMGGATVASRISSSVTAARSGTRRAPLMPLHASVARSRPRTTAPPLTRSIMPAFRFRDRYAPANLGVHAPPSRPFVAHGPRLRASARQRTPRISTTSRQGAGRPMLRHKGSHRAAAWESGRQAKNPRAAVRLTAMTRASHDATASSYFHLRNATPQRTRSAGRYMPRVMAASNPQSALPAGTITTVAGTGIAGSGGDSGPAIQAQMMNPFAVAVDGVGNLYIADPGNNRVRKVAAGTSTITTVAGTGVAGFGGDGGPATQAQLNSPAGVTTDAAGNLYIADNGNNRVRKVTISTGIITTVAGTGVGGYGGDGGPATQASLYNPSGVAVDGSGTLYITDATNNRVRKVTTSTGIITTVAGTGAAGAGGDSGPAT